MTTTGGGKLIRANMVLLGAPGASNGLRVPSQAQPCRSIYWSTTEYPMQGVGLLTNTSYMGVAEISTYGFK